MGAHSRLAPSAAARWVACPGSVPLSEQFPELLENPAAPEGTAAHWVVDQLMQGSPPAVDSLAPNAVVVTEEMVEGAILYAGHVMSIAAAAGVELQQRFRWEQREHMPSIHPEVYGTPDGAGVLQLEDLNGAIHVFDYKFGHAQVDPKDNWQLICYVRGVLDRLGFDGHAEQHLQVHLRIIQPRCYVSGGPIRTWSTTAADLRGHWNLLRAAAEEALGENPRLSVSEQCRYCPGRRACPELKRRTGELQDFAQLWQPVEIPPSALGLELSNLERAIATLQHRATGLREQAEFLLREGNSVPGWAMEPSRGVTEWSAPAEEVFSLGDMFGVELRKVSPPTPKQAAAIFKKLGIDHSVIDAYSSSRPGVLKLVPVSSTLAAKIFGA